MTTATHPLIDLGSQHSLTVNEIKQALALRLKKPVGNLHSLEQHEVQMALDTLPEYLITHIDKAAGKDLHMALAMAGIKDHYQFCSQVVGRRLSSLTQITYGEVLKVRRKVNDVTSEKAH